MQLIKWRDTGLRIIYLNAFCRDSNSRKNRKTENPWTGEDEPGNLWQSLQFEEMANKRRVSRAPPERTHTTKRTANAIDTGRRGWHASAGDSSKSCFHFSFSGGLANSKKDMTAAIKSQGLVPTRNYRWQTQAESLGKDLNNRAQLNRFACQIICAKLCWQPSSVRQESKE